MKASCIISLLFICVSVDLFAQPKAVETTYDLSNMPIGDKSLNI